MKQLEGLSSGLTRLAEGYGSFSVCRLEDVGVPALRGVVLSYDLEIDTGA